MRTHLDLASSAVAACATGLVLGVASAGEFADASRWSGDARIAVRLIAGARASASDAPLLRAGIEIRLAPGWKTYWRYPGDSGIPPTFDFKGSENVKTVTVLWPARLPYAGGVSIGYKDTVILPLRILPLEPEKPAVLRLKLEYGVCEALCMLAEAKAELALSGGRTSQDGALAAAEARVPKSAAPGDAGPLVIHTVRRENVAPRPRVVVDVGAPAAANVDLFAEGPTADWALPVPAPADDAPAGLRRFVFDLDGAPPGAKYDGALLKLTAVAGEDAIEVAVALD
jgi:DsbC/DsbD-like thiol-disulfide interchange protein